MPVSFGGSPTILWALPVFFDESYDGMLMVGFHDAASAPGNPTSHTMVSSRIFRLTVNGALWGEFEMYAHAAA